MTPEWRGPRHTRAGVIAGPAAHTGRGVTLFRVPDRTRLPARPPRGAAPRAAAVLATAVVSTAALLLPGCAAPGPAAGGASAAEVAHGAPGSGSPPAPVASAPDESAPVASAPGLDLARHSTSDPDSPWVVVNKRLPLDPAYEPDLVTVRGYLVRRDAATDLAALLAAADADGVHLTLRSAYRGYAKQAAVYDGWVAQLGAAGADEVSARPGHSEHQTGLAVDVGGSSDPGCDFEQCFAGTPEGRWVARHAADHGFVVRYTGPTTAVTGYAPEPWHLRWVGAGLAAHLRATGVATLEEAFGLPGGDYAR